MHYIDWFIYYYEIIHIGKVNQLIFEPKLIFKKWFHKAEDEDNLLAYKKKIQN